MEKKIKKAADQIIAYCVKCKEKRGMEGGKNFKMKSGMNAIKGPCVKCGTTMCKILGKGK